MKRLIQLIKKNKLAVAALLVFLFVATALILRYSKQSEDRLLPVTMNAITTKGGWGYEIFVDGKIFIKQQVIPSVPGYHSFTNKEQALAVGNLAVKKLVNGQIPSITETELKSLGVIK